MTTKFFVLISTLIMSWCGSLHAQDLTTTSESSSSDYIGFYQKYISGIRGQNCPMYPSCSNYALAEFRQTDFLTALIKSSDRLMRCGHDLDNYYLTMPAGEVRFLDYAGENNSPENLIYKNGENYFSYSDTIPSRDSALLFVRSLIDNGYYQQALLEIKRNEFNSKTINVDWFINELVCLKALGEYEKAIYEFEVKAPAAFKTNSQVLYVIATIYYKLENINRTLIFTQSALNNTSNLSETGKLLAFEGLLYANIRDWEKARNSFNIIPSPPYRQDLKMTYLKTVNDVKSIKYKSPTKASLLSIIPGLGYAYTGHKQTAISSFLLNGVLGYATYNSIQRKNYGLATLTGIFSASFYIANIYGANKSARRYNEQQTKYLINKIENNIKP